MTHLALGVMNDYRAGARPPRIYERVLDDPALQQVCAEMVTELRRYLLDCGDPRAEGALYGKWCYFYASRSMNCTLPSMIV